eukprot:gene44412-59263_t
MSSKNSRAETYLKIKRLKQVIASGHNYTQYLSEQNRYAALNTTDEARTKILQDVVNYKDNLKKSKHRILDAVFLPDCSVNPNTWFYSSILTQLNISKYTLSPLSMPDVHAFNTKRYEVQWMQFMRNELNLKDRDLIIAHGSSADALLRYMETDTINAAVIIDGSDIYTAGERHGRAYRYSHMIQNCHDITLVATTTAMEVEMGVLREGLELPPSRCVSLEPSTDLVDSHNNIAVDKLIRIVQ